jgi:pimeloyl-ACP methyl ester carboxylesterase
MKRWASVLGALAAVAACSSHSSTTSPPPPTAVYTAAALTRLSPYPSNRYAKADPSSATGIRVAIGPDDTNDPMLTVFPDTIAALNAIDGFSTLGGVSMSFSDDIDPTTVQRKTDGYATADSPMALVDVDPSSPENGHARGLVPRYYTTTGDDSAATVDFTLVVEPAQPLRPKTRYAFVLTDAVKTTSGVALTQSDDTRALLTGTAEASYGDSVRAALPVIETATGITKSHVVLATVFTTQTVHDVTLASATERRAAPPPTLQDTFTVQMTTGDATDPRVRFVGHFNAPEYRKAKPDSKWDVQDGKPVVQKTSNLELYIAFSDATSTAKRPIVIFQHGLGGDKDATWGTSQRLAPLNAAVFGIDAPEHGSRGDPPFPDGKTDLVQASMNFFGVNLDTKAFDMRIARDNFRQMAADQLELLRFIQTLGTLDILPVGAPDGIPDLDVTKILYLGHSFGSVMAATFNALAPEISASVWNVGGAGLTGLFHDSGLFSILTKSLEPADTPKSEVARFFSITQSIIDPGDAANYAPYTTLSGLPGVPNWRPKDVLLQEVRHDTIVPNSSSERLARAAGLAQVSPVLDAIAGLAPMQPGLSSNLASGATGGIFQFEIADGKTVDHGSLIFTTEGIKQYVEFFRGSLAGGHGAIINPY